MKRMLIHNVQSPVGALARACALIRKPSWQAAVILTALPALLTAHMDPDTKPGMHHHAGAVTVGGGNYQYQTVPDWGELPGGQAIGPTHGGVVVDPENGRVYVSTDAEHSILVYEPDGSFVGSIAPQCRGFHAMDIGKDNRETVIYGAQLQETLRVCKIDTAGNILLELSEKTHPDLPGGWKGVTGVAVAPDGSIFCSMGYGSNLIHKFGKFGSYIKSFGGKGKPEQGKVLTRTSHGLAVDTRFDPPRLLVCDRENRRLFHTDLDGQWIGEVATGLRRPCAVSVLGDLCAVAELEGRVTVLDKKGKVLTHLGDNPDDQQWANFRVELQEIKAGLFTAPHGLSFDAAGNLYVQDWNASGRITKLKKF
jgi:DNA-binding beta-propeller fold protein YncE